jgi:hypothetical protein
VNFSRTSTGHDTNPGRPGNFVGGRKYIRHPKRVLKDEHHSTNILLLLGSTPMSPSSSSQEHAKREATLELEVVARAESRGVNGSDWIGFFYHTFFHVFSSD